MEMRLGPSPPDLGRNHEIAKNFGKATFDRCRIGCRNLPYHLFCRTVLPTAVLDSPEHHRSAARVCSQLVDQGREGGKMRDAAKTFPGRLTSFPTSCTVPQRAHLPY